jgi:hypothetical protein
MRIIDVKIKSLDESTRFLYPQSRSIEIRTTSNNIITPIRAATDYEYHQKGLVPTDIPIDNPVYASVQDLSFSEFDKFMHQNGYYAKLIGKMELKSRLSQYSDLRLFLVKPTKSDRIDDITGERRYAPMTLLKQNPALLERFMRFIIQMQLEAEVNPITIPFIELPFSTYKELAFEATRSIESKGKQPVFFVDLGYENFGEIIDLLANHLDLNLIGLYFRSYRYAHLSYEILREYFSKDVAFLVTQVNRTDLNDISTMHYLPFFGNDIYAVKRPIGFQKTVTDDQGRRIEVPPEYSINKIQFFDKESLRVQPITKMPLLVENYAKEYGHEPLIRNMLENYRNADGFKDRCEALSAFSKVSELRSSSEEFKNFQKYISQNSAIEYINEKTVLKRTLTDVART